MAEVETTPTREEDIKSDEEEDEEEEEEEEMHKKMEVEDIGECLVSEERTITTPPTTTTTTAAAAAAAAKESKGENRTSVDDSEDNSHKRKYMNDTEEGTEIAPAKKKSHTKHDTEEDEHEHAEEEEEDDEDEEEEEEEDNKCEEAPVSSSSPMSVSGSRGISTYGFSAVAMSGLDNNVSDEIECPAALIGRLIGKQGETIKYLQGETNTKLQIDHKAQGDVKKVLITGATLDAVERVKVLIKEVLDSESGGVIPGEITQMVDCPQGIVGRVIGRHGETIRSLQAASGAKIVVEQNFPEGIPRKVKISGKPDVVDLAVKMVTELISGEPGSAIGVINKYTTNATAKRVVECPKSMIGRVIGKGGETIKTLQAQTGAVVHIQQDSDPCYITVSGSHPAVDAASSMVEEIARGGSPFRSTTSNPYMAPRPPSMSGYPHHYPPYSAIGGPPGSFGYGGGGGGGGGGSGGGYPHPPHHHHHAPSNYPYYGSLPSGGYNPQGFPPGPQMPAPPPPPGQAAYGGGAGGAGGGGGGYSGYIQQQQQQQPNPYGQPLYGQPLTAGGGSTGSGHYSTSSYSQGFAPHLPSESYQQGPMPPPMADGVAAHLAGHWTELHDAEGRLYYYNTTTGASQWDKPTDFQ